MHSSLLYEVLFRGDDAQLAKKFRLLVATRKYIAAHEQL